MTIGIYALSFNNYELLYIGQSINIANRYIKHCCLLKGGKHYNYKLQNAYNKYGIPIIDIIEETTLDMLTSLEDVWINEFNSIKEGLNLRSSEFTANSGINASRSVFTREQVVTAFELLSMEEHLPYSLISDISGVSRGIVQTIASGKVHLWLKEEFPEKYTYMISKLHTRASDCHSYKFNWPTLVSPEGVEYSNIKNLSKFAAEHNIHYPSLHKVAKGLYGRTVVQGWTVKK